MGEGRHVSFTLAAGGARSRCVAFGRGAGLPADPGQPVDAAVRLEVNRYNGAVEPRLVLRHAQPARPAPIEVVGEPGFAAALHAELERDLEAWPPGDEPRFLDDLRGRADGLGVEAGRTVRDARGGGIAGLLGDLVAAGEPVLAVTAHARHRARALRDRVGGFAVATWAALESDPMLAGAYTHVVAVDPPPHPHLSALATALPGAGWTHLAWGEPEEELARRVLIWELDLRAPLAEVYRALRAAATAAATDACLCGEPLAEILRGTGAQPRSGAVAGRLLRVLGELELVVVGTDPLAVEVLPVAERTEVERSPAFRAYARRLADGLAHLGAPDRAGEPVAPPREAAMAS
jgi:single-stranded-DNA-specific exonuclease